MNTLALNTPAEIQDALARLRQSQERLRRTHTQADVVQSLYHWAQTWQDPASPYRRAAESLTEPFPIAHAQGTLDALLASLTPPALRALIDSEGVAGAVGVPVIGHVIAGNTPFLAWTSVLRALLMRSASLVKLPRSGGGDWARLFHQSLADTAPALAECITLAQWPGGTEALDSALCGHADLIMAHGSDAAMAALRVLTPPQTPFVPYGHALSFGLVLEDADLETAADGLARDALLFSGAGCLSVKAVYVRGSFADARRFARRLADAMQTFNRQYPLPAPSPANALLLREAHALGALWPEAETYAPSAAPYQVLLWPERPCRVQSGDGVVTVQAWPARAPWAALWRPVLGHLQGCALAGDATPALRARLDALGVSRLCPPGQLQCPPLAWRQNNRDLLRPLLGSGP